MYRGSQFLAMSSLVFIEPAIVTRCPINRSAPPGLYLPGSVRRRDRNSIPSIDDDHAQRQIDQFPLAELPATMSYTESGT